jgi:hypothetical protein
MYELLFPNSRPKNLGAAYTRKNRYLHAKALHSAYISSAVPKQRAVLSCYQHLMEMRGQIHFLAILLTRCH